MEIAKGFFGPDVETAFIGITGGELNDSERGRDKEKERRKNPKADGRGSVVGSGGDPTWAEYGCDIEQQYVPKSHLPSQLRLNVGDRRRRRTQFRSRENEVRCRLRRKRISERRIEDAGRQQKFFSSEAWLFLVKR